jgi:ABC-type Na+ efflux pump permease subunit
MRSLDFTRVRAVVRKELRDYRRKRSIVVGMAVLPVVFLIEPIVGIFVVPAPAAGSALNSYVVLPLLYMLLIPVVMPATLAAYSIVGEREQGTLEPLLSTPIRRQEFILGKAAAVMIPSLILSYLVFGLFLVAVALFAHAAVATAVFHQGPILLALFLFAPLLCGWAVVVGLAISVRATEVRVAQQLGTLASFPPLAVVALFVAGVIHPTFKVAALFAVALLLLDMRALRLVSGMFDRERLVTGAKGSRGSLWRALLPGPLRGPAKG